MSDGEEMVNEYQRGRQRQGAIEMTENKLLKEKESKIRRRTSWIKIDGYIYIYKKNRGHIHSILQSVPLSM